VHSRPLVSAITIFLDGERYIGDAIESVLAQTYENWELLLVDDGSSDGSTRVAQRYARQRPDKIRYLEHPGHQNRGMSASRNLGIAQTKGAFVAFLDADDVWLPTKLEEQLAIFGSHPKAGMVYGRTLIWHSWAQDSADGRRDYTMELGVPPDTLVQPPQLLPVLLRNKAQTPTTCNAIVRREVLDAVGGFEERFRGMYEDQAFFAKVHLRVPVYVSGACWAKYRQHPESCSANTSTVDYYASRLPLLDWLANYVEKQGIPPNSAVWNVLHEELCAAQHPRLHRLRLRLRGLARRAKRQLHGRSGG
jgi:glycosyltransferase involved in cell wall biosynthesis